MKKGFGLVAIILLSAASMSAHAVEGSKRGSKQGEEASRRASRVLRIGPSTTYLKNGLSLEEVVMLLGKPVSRSESLSGEVRLTTCIFARSGGRVLVAEFENGVLVASRTEVRRD